MQKNNAIAVFCAILIAGLSLTPSTGGPSFLASPYDKAAHFSAYAVLAGLIIRNKGILFTLILSGGYGIVIELAQAYVPGRNRDVYDALANTAGAICGITLGRLILWRK